MTSTTRSCIYCGKDLPLIETHTFKSLEFPLYGDCDCEESKRVVADFGRELAERGRRERLARAGIKERYIDATHERAAELAQKVIEGKSLYVYGGFGTGKTHLASAIARELVDRCRSVRMLTGIDLIMRLQSTFGSHESEAAVLDGYSHCSVLVLDDLGKEPPTDYVLSRLFAIVNERYDSMRPVIVTTNYERGELIERLGKNGDHDHAEGIVSRLKEMCLDVPMKGDDRRLS